eukprot:6998235-Pyramimonas_sp.AAC.1
MSRLLLRYSCEFVVDSRRQSLDVAIRLRDKPQGARAPRDLDAALWLAPLWRRRQVAVTEGKQ